MMAMVAREPSAISRPHLPRERPPAAWSQVGRGALCGRQTLSLRLFGKKARIPAQLLPRGTVVWLLTSGPSAAGSWGCLRLLQLVLAGGQGRQRKRPRWAAVGSTVAPSQPAPAPLCSRLCSVAVSDSASLWTVALQAPLSMGSSRQEYWSGFPFAFPGDLPNPGIKPTPPALSGRLFLTTEPPGNSSLLPGGTEIGSPHLPM